MNQSQKTAQEASLHNLDGAFFLPATSRLGNLPTKEVEE